MVCANDLSNEWLTLCVIKTNSVDYDWIEKGNNRTNEMGSSLVNSC